MTRLQVEMAIAAGILKPGVKILYLSIFGYEEKILVQNISHDGDEVLINGKYIDDNFPFVYGYHERIIKILDDECEQEDM